MNEIQTFSNVEFGEIRTTELNNKPYFVGSDIAKVLGYKEPHKAVSRHCKGGIKRTILTNGGNQELVVIPEGDVYRLIIKSKLPSAEKFECWIMDQVLPQIRQTGGYIPIQEEESNEVFLARAVQIANETIKHKDEIIAAQKKRIEFLEETEKDWKLLMDCKGTFSVNEIAHFIGIGEYKLFARMREVGILFKNENGDNVPYEKPVHKGKFISIPAIAPDGSAHLQTRVYPEGISYITTLLRKYGYLEVA